jgi:GH24 family phage-related lysozyme (muramidase)
MNLLLQRRWAERWEGRRSFAYDDKTETRIRLGVPLIGKPTIGVGLNLATAAARMMIVGLGLDFTGVSEGQIELTDSQIDKLLGISLNTAIGDARTLFPAFGSFPATAQLVITDLSFNLGGPTLATFTRTCAAIRAGNWTAAAGELRASRWFHQVGDKLHERGGANVAVLAGSIDPESILNSH